MDHFEAFLREEMPPLRLLSELLKIHLGNFEAAIAAIGSKYPS